MIFAKGILWKRERAGGPLGKLMCVREEGVHSGAKATTGEINVGHRRRAARVDGEEEVGGSPMGTT